MLQDRYYLWEKGKTPYFNPDFKQDEPFLTPFISEGQGNIAVIVCPGGAYVGKAGHEGAPIAQMLQANGISGFVLDYRVTPYRYPAIRADVNRAVRFVRYHAKEFGVDPDKIGVLGFSAGGHLALMAANLWDEGLGEEAIDEIDRVSCRVNASILCYPVLNLMPSYSHFGTHDNLLAGLPDEADLSRALSAPALITEQTPPTFLWQTFEDNAVPLPGMMEAINAMFWHKVPCEVHIYPDGPHGLGLGTEHHIASWSPLLVKWLKKTLA